MSHELRTPLTSIIAFTEIWQNANTERSEDETAAVKEVKENGQLLLQMVNNILEMARVEAGRTDLIMEPFDMMDLIGPVSYTHLLRSVEDLSIRVAATCARCAAKSVSQALLPLIFLN